MTSALGRNFLFVDAPDHPQLAALQVASCLRTMNSHSSCCQEFDQLGNAPIST